MPLESEAKFQVKSFSPIRRTLRQIGGVHLRTVVQTDVFLDTPRSKLRKTGCGLRLRRQTRLAGRSDRVGPKAFLTFKGPRRPDRKIKIRQEIEAPVEYPEGLLDILQASGLTIAAIIQKRRATYRLESCLVELDELPHIGRFVEIEGPSEAKIRAVAAKLSLTGKPILESYLHLLSEFCRSRGLSSREILLPK